VIDPRRTANAALGYPQTYAYGFFEDLIIFTIRPIPTLMGRGEARFLTSCNMVVDLISDVTEPRSLVAWNYKSRTEVNSVSTSGNNRGPNAMVLQRGRCDQGAHTIIFKKGIWNMYTLDPTQLWDHWGGMHVSVHWTDEPNGSRVWGEQVPEPNYPIVKFPDFTILRSLAQPGQLFVVFGGAKFRIPTPETTGLALGLNIAAARLERADLVNSIPTDPVDRTVLRELSDSAIYVVFGGVKFQLPDSATINRLGFGSVPVRVIPDGGLNQLSRVPLDFTLLQEESATDPNPNPTFVSASGILRPISNFAQSCFAPKHRHVVPGGALALLPRGPAF
jgi:hypothetical protein